MTYLKKQDKNSILEWVITIILALILAFLIYRFVCFKVSVPSPSMSPTIEPGDQIFVTRIYRPSHIKRGEIVVFHSNELKERLIKRVIGIPGDKVTIKNNGEVYINGKKSDESYVKYPGGKTDMTFDVPKGEFLMLGDNRNNSCDARYWNNPYISSKDIQAKAQVIVYPFSRFKVLK